MIISKAISRRMDPYSECQTSNGPGDGASGSECTHGPVFVPAMARAFIGAVVECRTRLSSDILGLDPMGAKITAVTRWHSRFPVMVRLDRTIRQTTRVRTI